MRKLNKINLGRLDTIEAYACACRCSCTNACAGCGCAVTTSKSTPSNNLNTSETYKADSNGYSAGYRK